MIYVVYFLSRRGWQAGQECNQDKEHKQVACGFQGKARVCAFPFMCFLLDFNIYELLVIVTE